MTNTFDSHVFAHKDGRYQTTHASTGITSAERAALEQFFFGQTNDERYLASLAQEPGVIWRRVGVRYALTRVLAGKKDAGGRATLQFETLVIAPEAIQLTDNLADLVRSNWRFSRQGVSSTRSAEARPLDLHMDKVSSIVLHFRESKRVVVRSGTLSLRDVEKIVSLCRNDPAFSLAYRSLNDRAPVAINLVFGDVTERQIMSRPPKTQSRPNPEPIRSAPSRPPTTGVFVPIALCLIILVQVITLFAAGPSSDPSPSDEMQKHIITRIERESGKLSKDFRAGLAETSNKIEDISQELSELKEQSKQRNSELESELEKAQGAVNDLKNTVSKLSQDSRRATDNLLLKIDADRAILSGELQVALETLKTKMGSLGKGQKGIVETLGKIAKRVGADENGATPWRPEQ